VPELFIGESLHKLDGKGRVSIPALFRRVLEEGDGYRDTGTRPRVVIGYGDPNKKFLECYTYAAFQEVAAEILAMPRGSRERAILERNFLGKAHLTEIDPDGRLVLPQKVRDKAGLELNSEVFFLGAGNTFQIWNPTAHEATDRAETEGWLADQPEDFDMLLLIDRHKRERQGG
jgi:MraZ protein